MKSFKIWRGRNWFGGISIFLFFCVRSVWASPLRDLPQYIVPATSLHGAYLFNTLPNDIRIITKDLTAINRLIAIQPEIAGKLINNVYWKSKGINYYPGMVSALCYKAALQKNRGHLDSAFLLYKAAIPLSFRCGPKNNAHKIYINMGGDMALQGNYEQALQYYYESINTMRSYNLQLSNTDSATLFYNIALGWHKLGESQKALEALAVLKRITEQGQSIRSLIRYYCMYTTVQPQLEDSKILAYQRKVVDLSSNYNDIETLIPAINDLCKYYLNRRQFDTARIYLNKAFALLEQHPGLYNFNHFHALANLGLILKGEQKYTEAEKVFEEIYAKAESVQFTDWMLEMEPALAEIYSINNKNAKAYEHMKHYAGILSTVFLQQKTRSTDHWMKSRVAEKDKELLRNKLHISEQHAALQQKNFWIATTTLGILLLCSALIAFLLHYRSKQKLQRAAIAQMRQVQEIDQLKALVRGEEQERNRKLHDGIASQLWAVKLHIDNLIQEQEIPVNQKQSLRDIYNHLDETTQDVRKTAHNLMPGLLLEEGLSSALLTLCEKTEKSTNIEVDFMECGNIPPLDMEILLSLYRMVQELIQNVLKHAQATLLLIQLSCVNNMLNITIEDNGIGCSAFDSKKETGLRNIRRRVNALKGSFDIRSSPGCGTNIYMEFDIRYLVLSKSQKKNLKTTIG